MSFYSDLAKTALGLLAQFGQTITRREYASGEYNPELGTALQTTTDTSRKGALFDFGSGVTSVRGQLIQAIDKRLLLDASEVATVTDHFIINGTEYTVVTLGEINPAGKAVLYDLHVRNG